MQKIDKLAIASIIGFFALFAYMSHLDYQDQLAAEEHAKYVQQLAKDEAAAKKAEFNKLAKRGEQLTGIGAREQ
jgi:hypothetical protein